MDAGGTFSLIYETHAPAVYRCLLAWSRNPSLAEDLTAETFFRALAAKQPIKAQTARAYLVAIARNLHHEHHRKHWRQQPLEAAPPLTTAAAADNTLTLERTLEALGALPEALREPLVLYAIGGLAYDEIAAQLRLPIATVKIRIFRARQRLEPFR